MRRKVCLFHYCQCFLCLICSNNCLTCYPIKANKKKEEAERKVKEAARQLDHLVRAVRIEELPQIRADYEAKIKEDRENYKQEVVEKSKRAKEQWTLDVEEKKDLVDCSVFNYSSVFESRIMTARKVIHNKLCKEEDERAEQQAEKGKLTRARKVRSFSFLGYIIICYAYSYT